MYALAELRMLTRTENCLGVFGYSPYKVRGHHLQFVAPKHHLSHHLWRHLCVGTAGAITPCTSIPIIRGHSILAIREKE